MAISESNLRDLHRADERFGMVVGLLTEVEFKKEVKAAGSDEVLERILPTRLALTHEIEIPDIVAQDWVANPES